MRIDGRAWVPRAVLTDSQVNAIRRSTTVRLRPGPYDEAGAVIKMAAEGDFAIGLPRGFYHRTARGGLPVEYDVTETRRVLVPAVFPRDDMQREGVDTLSKYLLSERVREGMLLAATGTGKTVMGLLIAAKMGMTTLIVVHTTMLLNQWVERIKTEPGVFPDADVGIFRGDDEEFGGDYDIVIAMVQTLANRSADHPIFDWPGFIIVDECHRLGAPTWNEVAHYFKAAKRLGLTATPRRSDGGEQLFFDTLGDIVWEAKAPMMVPRVRKVKTAFRFKKDSYPLHVETTIMVRDSARNALIVQEIALARKSYRHILVLVTRTEHALRLKRLINAQVSDASVGVCVGSWYADEDDAFEYCESARDYQDKFKTDEGKYSVAHNEDKDRWETGDLIDDDIHKVSWKDKDRGKIKKVKPRRRRLSEEAIKEAVQCDIVIATEKMVKEGFDVPSLDTLFITMPTWDPVQSTGRILRLHEEKQEPIVTHFVDDNVKKYVRAWHSSRKHYQDLGSDI